MRRSARGSPPNEPADRYPSLLAARSSHRVRATRDRRSRPLSVGHVLHRSRSAELRCTLQTRHSRRTAGRRRAAGWRGATPCAPSRSQSERHRLVAQSAGRCGCESTTLVLAPQRGQGLDEVVRTGDGTPKLSQRALAFPFEIEPAGHGRFVGGRGLPFLGGSPCSGAARTGGGAYSARSCTRTWCSSGGRPRGCGGGIGERAWGGGEPCVGG